MTYRKVVMSASALLMALVGVAATFAPDELLAQLGAPPMLLLHAAMQLGGALYLGSAATNWTARESLVGGIYNRPITLGNTMHFTVAALGLLKVAMTHPTVGAMSFTTVYVIFALAFTTILFTSPVAPVDEGR